MKRLLMLLLMTSLCCTSCTALPAEERAFAVALGVEREGETWRMYGRIPTYKTGGGYLTITGEGKTIAEALASMDASAPMHLHLSQLRLLVLDAGLGESEDAALVLHELSARADMRQHCAVAVTETTMKTLMEALQPAAGARLSKAIDVLLETRREQGVILSAMLADIARMGERQTPVLIGLGLEEKDLILSGGVPTTNALRFGRQLSAKDISLLSLLLGETKKLHLSLPDGSAEIRDASVRLQLSADMRTAQVEMNVQVNSATYTEASLAQILADECLTLLARLSGEGCDALGLGRKAILKAKDMKTWNDLNWPDAYRHIQWSVSVGVQGPA